MCLLSAFPMHLKERMFLYNMRNKIARNWKQYYHNIIILYEYGLAATIMIVKSCWTDIYHEFRATSIYPWTNIGKAFAGL